MKLYDLTSDSVVYFLAGSLPASALLHIRQLGLFCMISRVPNNILHRIAKHVLITVRDNSKSWFIHIKSLYQQCSLPHPLLLLDSPLTKIAAKKLIKAKVTDFWEKKLRHESTLLPSLTYFKPSFMSLTTHHPLWTTCQDNPFELSKCLIQSKLLSGRYRTDRLLRHFDKNRTGNCSLCLNGSDGSLEHLLVLCPALTQCCDQQFLRLNSHSGISDKARSIIAASSQKSVPDFTQLLLDCSVVPEVIEASQNSLTDIISDIFKFTRTWCFNVHMQRMKMLG